MQSSNIPVKFAVPFANAAGASYIRTIPQASQIGVTPGAASLTDGFPPLNFLPTLSGGVAPSGLDFNGVLFQSTGWARWFAAGGPVKYDASFQSGIGGYPLGAMVESAVTFGLFWVCTTENNTTNPDSGGAGWANFFSYLAPPFVRTRLTANVTYYVSLTGNDTTGTGASGAPWATPAKAISYIQNTIDFAGLSYTATIQLADGSYPTPVLVYAPWTGGSVSSVILNGDAATPSATVLVGTSSQQSGVYVRGGGCGLVLTNLTIATPSSIGVQADQSSNVTIGAGCRFAACGLDHIAATNGGLVGLGANYSVVGSAVAHLFASGHGRFVAANTLTVALSGTPAFSLGFAVASDLGGIFVTSAMVTWSGSATGPRYYAINNAVIDTVSSGASYFPGSTAGSVVGNGIYA